MTYIERLGELMNTIWKEAPFSRAALESLYKTTGGRITPLTLRILLNRGINTDEKLKEFLGGNLEDLLNPFLMKDMDKGIKIMCDAIKNGEKIMIYGDYDADGVTSTAILYKALKKCGAKIGYHIPHRENEGYGMSEERIELIAKDGYDLIISCDNGISAIKEVKKAKELGLKVIITDHHELPFEEIDGVRKTLTPNSDALINPKREDCEYPFKLLCGAGIAYKFSIALFEALGMKNVDSSDILELAAIGTICDVVDLVGENRIIAKEGLKLLTNTKNKGLKALKAIIGIEGNVSCYNVGFNIGPCINATGRLETALMSLELLIGEDERKLREIAGKVHSLNIERQNLTMESVEKVCYEIENSSIKNDKVLVVYNESIHESIAGIVAGRVKEKYGKPTFILTAGKEMPKGSGRSIEEFNMFEEMIKCKEYLYKFGGHPMAAGLSIEQHNIDNFRKALNEGCHLTEADLAVKLNVDSSIKLCYVNEAVVNELRLLEPFGKGNPSPLLMASRVKVNSIRFLGSEQQHVKFDFFVEGPQGRLDGLFFNGREATDILLQRAYGDGYLTYIDRLPDFYLDILFQPDINEYMGRRTVQLKIKDIRTSK